MLDLLSPTNIAGSRLRMSVSGPGPASTREIVFRLDSIEVGVGCGQEEEDWCFPRAVLDALYASVEKAITFLRCW